MVELESHASGSASEGAASAPLTLDDGAPYGAVTSSGESIDAAQSEAEVEAPDALRLRLKLLDERVVEVAAARSMSIASFRVAVAHATQVPVYRQRLIYRGKLLKDGTALSAYDVRDGHTVHVVAKPSGSPNATSQATQEQQQQQLTGSREVATATNDDENDENEDDGRVGTAIRRNREYMRQLMSSEDEQSRDASNRSNTQRMRRRSPGPGDPTGTAWNMGVLREALSGGRTEPMDDATTTTQRIHGVRDLFGDDDGLDDASSVAASMGLSSTNSSTMGPRPNVDHIFQGVLTLRTVLSTATGHTHQQQEELSPSVALERAAEQEQEQAMQFEDVDASVATVSATVSSLSHTRRGRRRFFVGQWLDVKDTVNQWLESTVMAVADDKVLVHYHGWPARWDEWIDVDSDRLAAFRTRTVHTINASQLSPAPVTRLPNAPSVGGRDVRDVVVALRDAMREMLPLVERFADLCEAPAPQPSLLPSLSPQNDLFYDDDSDSDNDNGNGNDTDRTNEETAARHAAELSEMAHLMAPLFDRFGRVLADSAHTLEPLFAPELRSYTQERHAQQVRASALRGRSPRQPTSAPSALELRDTSLSVRDLISTVLRTPAEAQPVRRNIDVHIHAILAPSSLQSFASLARAATNGSLLETANAPPTRRPRAPQTPPAVGSAFGLPSLREPLGGSGGRALVNDDAGDSDHSDRESVDHSRTPLLGSLRRRHDSRSGSSSSGSSNSTSRRRRAVDQNLDSFLADDFFGTSYGNDSDEHDDSAAPANSRSAAPSGRDSTSRFSYRPIPSPHDRDSRDVSLSQDGVPPTSASPSTLGVIPEIAEADERARAQETMSSTHSDSRRRTDADERARGDSSSSSSSVASSASSSGSNYPSFLEFMRRSLRRNFGFAPQPESESQGQQQDDEQSSSEEEAHDADTNDDDLPALESALSIVTPLSAHPVSTDRRASSSSDSSIEEEEMDRVD